MPVSDLWSEPNLDQLAKQLHPLFPDLALDAPISLLGMGFSTIVVETADGVVLRIARTAEVGSRFAAERRWLPLLAGELSVAVPEPEWIASSTDDFPFGVIGYRKLAGTAPEPANMSTADLDRLAQQTGSLVAELHDVPLFGADARPVNRNVRLRSWTGLRTACRDALRSNLTEEENDVVNQWWIALLDDQTLFDYRPVLTHGDLWFGNLLLDGNTLCGVLDWENVGADDPALDFAPQLYLGEHFFTTVLDAYAGAVTGADAHLVEGIRTRVDRLFALREFSGLQTALAYHDAEEIQESIAKICRSPILNHCR